MASGSLRVFAATAMNRTTARQVALLCAAALVPFALGYAMHLEHEEAIRACEAQPAATTVIAGETRVLAMPTPIAVTPASTDAPQPVGPGAGAYEFAHVIDIDGPHIVLA